MGADWLGLCEEAIPVGDVLEWAGAPDCGGVVLFSGTVRDRSEGRPGVTGLEYEAYTAHVTSSFAAVAADARARWPEVQRIAVLHRTGELKVGETAVLVVVGAPHREEAFAAARYLIDTVKATAPIWKRESWAGGAEWVGHA